MRDDATAAEMPTASAADMPSATGAPDPAVRSAILDPSGLVADGVGAVAIAADHAVRVVTAAGKTGDPNLESYERLLSEVWLEPPAA